MRKKIFRRIANHEKVLSLHEPDAHVLVRGKGGAEVEFGNGLYLEELGIFKNGCEPVTCGHFPMLCFSEKTHPLKSRSVGTSSI
ncbi:MAG: hypothetical protein DRP64_00705 [Verrucomicrobia bacterium]|nr:MAG: hypothetical protein DRP64_00705 [Verrucomicrobiota bacterium]